jgi:hypothetical protein
MAPAALPGSTMDNEPLLDAFGELRADGRRLDHPLRDRQPFSRVLIESRTPRGRLIVSRSAVPVFDALGVRVRWPRCGARWRGAVR